MCLHDHILKNYSESNQCLDWNLCAAGQVNRASDERVEAVEGADDAVPGECLMSPPFGKCTTGVDWITAHTACATVS